MKKRESAKDNRITTRFPPLALRRLRWLQRNLGVSGPSDVLVRAVNDLYEQRRALRNAVARIPDGTYTVPHGTST